MMEWVLKDHECADPYIDDKIIGSKGSTEEEMLENHESDLRAVLATLAKQKLYVDPRKAHLFMREVEFCGHVLRQGRRSPAPGKLLAIQKWEAPKTVTQLRGFLGLTNYYSGYVKGYAGLAAPLMDLLKVNKADGKKGSQKPLKWGAVEQEAFESLKKALAAGLELFQINVDKPFVMRTDASDWAIGAVLEQDVEGRLVPVAFYSRKLGGSQLNWTPREKECYAIVACLRKWAGWIGFQPVVIMTDHRSLEEWTTENIDTPSGPRGRKARWHETLSQFNLEVKYVPGKENVIADAMSRFAYPATSAREDVSFHGSSLSKEEVRRMLIREKEEEKEVAIIQLGRRSLALPNVQITGWIIAVAPESRRGTMAGGGSYDGEEVHDAPVDFSPFAGAREGSMDLPGPLVASSSSGDPTLEEVPATSVDVVHNTFHMSPAEGEETLFYHSERFSSPRSLGVMDIGREGVGTLLKDTNR
jgi:hypothetical protein